MASAAKAGDDASVVYSAGDTGAAGTAINAVSKERTYDLVLDKLYDRANNKFIPEDDKNGNIEYKRRLDKKDKRGLQTMILQMMSRMTRGHMDNGIYDAHYILGVDDNGDFSGLAQKEVIHTSKILRAVIAGSMAKIVSEKIYMFAGNDTDSVNSHIMHVHIVKNYKIDKVPEVNAFIAGPSGTSKTSIFSNLVYGQVDNARGLSRELSLRHPHEKETGKTTAPKHETIGCDGTELLNYECSINFDMEHIMEDSSLLYNIIDLPGEDSHIKTMIHSVMSLKPNIMYICVPITNIIEYMTDNYERYAILIELCRIHNIVPTFVITKTDLQDTDIDTTINNLHEYLSSKRIPCETILAVNNMSSSGINEIKHHLIDYCARYDGDRSGEGDANVDADVDAGTDGDRDVEEDDVMIYRFNEVFQVPPIGSVYHGTMERGSFDVGSEVYVICNGTVMTRKILSIHRKAMDVDRLAEGETGSIRLSRGDKLDKTAVITNKAGIKTLCTEGYIEAGEVPLVKKQYRLFVQNLIVPITIAHVKDRIYKFKTLDSVQILLRNYDDTHRRCADIGCVLRDTQRNIVFAKILSGQDVSDTTSSDDSESSDIW